MFALTRLCEGLLVAHLFLAASFLAGAAAFPWFRTQRDEHGAVETMLRVVCTCGLGIAILGIALFLLAQLHAFTPPAFVATFVLIVVLGAVCSKESPLQTRYWSSRVQVLTDCADGTLLFMYYVMLLVAVPCVIPNVGGDPIQYHLAYAQDWVNAHGFVVDPFLRFPFYASYFNLFFAALLALQGWAFLNFLTWSTALLTGLGICAATFYILRPFAGRFTPVAAVSLACSVVLSPVFLHWTSTAYMDVQLGTMALLMTVCIELSLWHKQPAWLFVAAVIGGYLVGMKSAYLVLAPLLALSLFFAARGMKLDRRTLGLIFALFIVAAAPWYVRNIALAGDPIPPVVNIALHGNDGLTTKQDWDGIKVDLNSNKSAWGLLTLPARAFLRPLRSDFRDYGMSAIIFVLFVPGLMLFGSFCSGTKLDAAWAIPIFVLSGMIAYWLGTASHLRYGLSLYPLLALGCALCMVPFLRRFPRAAPLAAAFALLTTIPSYDGYLYYRELTFKNYRFLSVIYNDDGAYLRTHDPGYLEEEFVTAFYRAHHLRGRVYAIGGATPYFFRSHGIVSLGEWIGPTGYFRLYHAADLRKTAQFLAGLDVHAVLIEPGFAFGGIEVPIERQLLAAGFCKVDVPGGTYAFLVDGPCAQRPSPT